MGIQDNTTITTYDLLGRSYNNAGFGIMTSNNIMQFLDKIIMSENITLYNMKFNNSVNFGHICTINNAIPTQLLFYPNENQENNTTKLIDFAHDYEYVAPFDNGYIWKPIGSIDYMAIGLVYALSKPTNLKIGVVHKKYVLNTKSGIANFTAGNEFGLLSHYTYGSYTLNRPVIMEMNTNFKLSSYNNEYITQINNTINIAPSSLLNQNINYTPENNLSINNKCIDIANSKIVVNQCNKNTLSQKWYPFQNKFKSYSSDACLATDTDAATNIANLITDDCAGNNSDWAIQNTDSQQFNVSGEKVILVETNNPWYINVNADQIPAKFKQLDFDKLNYYKYKPADVQHIETYKNTSNIKIPKLSPKLKKTHIILIAVLLSIICVVLYLLYRYLKSRKPKLYK